MSTEYGHPELQITISNRLLRKLLASNLTSFLPCPPNPDDKSTLFTDIVIDEIVALRADDEKAKDRSGIVAAGKGSAPQEPALQSLGKAFNFQITDNAYIALRGGAVGSVLETPTIFFVVSGSVRLYQAADLRRNGTTDEVFPTLFKRTAQAGELSAPALLFSARVIRTTQPQRIQAIRFALEGVWDSKLAETFKPLLAPIKGIIPPLDLPFTQFEPLLQAVGFPNEILNIGLTTEFWTDGNTPGNIGLRIGIDGYGPLKPDLWKPFFKEKLWLADHIALEPSDLAVLVDGQIFVDRFTGILAMQPAPQVPNVYFAAPTVELDSGKITVNLAARNGNVPLGNAVVTLTPSVSQRNIPHTTHLTSYLDIHACARFDENPGGAVFIWFISTFAGTVIGGIGGPVGAIIGAIGGTYVGVSLDLALNSAGNEAIKKNLAGANPDAFGLDGLACGLVDSQGCRSCSRNAEYFLSGNIGLLLSDSAWEKQGIGLAWTVRNQADPKPAKLFWRADPWGYDLGICHAPDRDPVRAITFRNDGEVPLRICWVGQDVSLPTDVAVLQISPPVDGAVAPAILLAPGQATSVKAIARITGNNLYNQAQPPPLFLRALSTAGSIDIDLNVPEAAVSQDPQANQQQAAWGELLCLLLHTRMLPTPIWRQIPFTDPVSNPASYRVIERLDIELRDVPAQEQIFAVDVGNRVLAAGQAQRGTVNLIIADERAAAASHQFAHLAVTRGAMASRLLQQGIENDPERAEPRHEGHIVAARHHGSTARSLYVSQGSIALYSRMQNAIQVNSQIVVLTQDSLSIGSVGRGTIAPWKRIPFLSPRAVTPWATGMAIGTDTGLYYCTNELDIILLQAGSVAALAATDHYLALSDGKRLHLVTTEKKRCHVTHTINLPDIVQLLSARNNVFALAGGQVWRLQDKTIIEVGLRADRLAPFQGNYVAACKAGRTMILDPEGREVMEYTGTPWLVNVLEWPYMAVELDYPLNTLNLFARFPTLINAPEALKRVPDLSQNSN